MMFTIKPVSNKRTSLLLISLTAIASIAFAINPITSSAQTEVKKASVTTELASEKQLIKELPTVLPGEFLSFRVKKHLDARPDIYFGRHQATVLDDKSHWRVLVGVSKNTIAGKYLITGVEKDKSNFSRAFLVLPQAPVINEISKRSTNLLNRLSIRNKRKKRSDHILPKELPWSNLEPKLPLLPPMDLSTSSTSKMISEEQVYSEPDAQMIRFNFTGENNPVRSPSTAILLKVKQTSRGYEVVLDHGMGIFSHISGLTSVNISEQDFIKGSSVIGYSGESQKNTVSGKTKSDSPSEEIISSIEWHVVMNGQFISPKELTAKSSNDFISNNIE